MNVDMLEVATAISDADSSIAGGGVVAKVDAVTIIGGEAANWLQVTLTNIDVSSWRHLAALCGILWQRFTDVVGSPLLGSVARLHM